ncbi:hypothetical protein ACOME3_005853 [Neoechinorhynchus agilis]
MCVTVRAYSHLALKRRGHEKVPIINFRMMNPVNIRSIFQPNIRHDPLLPLVQNRICMFGNSLYVFDGTRIQRFNFEGSIKQVTLTNDDSEQFGDIVCVSLRSHDSCLVTVQRRSGLIKIYEFVDDQRVHLLCQWKHGHRGIVRSVLSLSTEVMATAGSEGTVRLWQSKACFRVINNSDHGPICGLYAGSTSFYVAHEQGTLFEYDIDQGMKELRHFSGNRVLSMAHLEADIVFGCVDGTIYLWKQKCAYPSIIYCTEENDEILLVRYQDTNVHVIGSVHEYVFNDVGLVEKISHSAPLQFAVSNESTIIRIDKYGLGRFGNVPFMAHTDELIECISLGNSKVLVLTQNRIFINDMNNLTLIAECFKAQFSCAHVNENELLLVGTKCGKMCRVNLNGPNEHLDLVKIHETQIVALNHKNRRSLKIMKGDFFCK